jgi:hypothetical protein
MRYHDWIDAHGHVTEAQPVVRQATDAAAAAVRQIVAGALQAADGGGCHQCRRRAVQTATWAADMLSPDPVAPVTGRYQPGRWR